MGTRKQNIKKVELLADQLAQHAKKSQLDVLAFIEADTPNGTRGTKLVGYSKSRQDAVFQMVNALSRAYPMEFFEALRMTSEALESNKPVEVAAPATGDAHAGDDAAGSASASVADGDPIHGGEGAPVVGLGDDIDEVPVRRLASDDFSSELGAPGDAGGE